MAKTTQQAVQELYGLVVAQSPNLQRVMDPYFGRNFYAKYFQSNRLWPSTETMLADLFKAHPDAAAIVPSNYDDWLKYAWQTNGQAATPAIGAHIFWALAKLGKPVDAIGYMDTGAIDDATWRLRPNSIFMKVPVYDAMSDKRRTAEDLLNILRLTPMREVFTKIRFSNDPNYNNGTAKFVAGDES